MKTIKKLLPFVMVLLLMLGMTACGTDEQSVGQDDSLDLTGKSLMVYCGAGMKEPFQEITSAFQEKTGCEVNVNFANAAQIQTQINKSGEGDMFVAGSAEELKPVSDKVSRSIDLVKHIPVIAVQKGNPENITTIADLAGGVGVVTGDPEATPIGKIAMKMFADEGINGSVNIIATTTTAPQLTTALEAGEADAAIVWKENVKGDQVEIAEVEGMDKYIKVIPAASLNLTKDDDTLKIFEEFLGSEEAMAIWQNFGYEAVNAE